MRLGAARIWEAVEIVLTASRPFGNPYRDVKVWAVCVGPDGQTLRVPGFWDGGQTWRIRVSLPSLGRWTIVTGASVDDDGLVGVSRLVEVRSWSPDELESNPLRHGFLRVSASGRYLEHADGTPFYWLGDTLWAGAWRGCPLEPDFREYIANRVEKRFTVVQMVAGHPAQLTDRYRSDSYLGGGFGDTLNEAGAPFVPREGSQRVPAEPDPERINPAYFQLLDLKVQALVEAGLIPCLLGMWGFDLGPVSVDALSDYWRYLVARYGAYPVVWCVSGEYLFTNDVEGFRQLGQAVHEADPYGHPTCIHSTAPHSDSRHYHDDDWCDFHMPQLGHALGLWQLLEALPNHDFAMEPPKPSVFSEHCYENHMDTLGERARRFSDAEIRYASYVPLLSGCVGQTYGAQGIWMWAHEHDEQPEVWNWNAPMRWQQALDLPVAGQMKHLRALFESVRWWDLRPRREIATIALPHRIVAASVGDDQLLAYVSGGPSIPFLFLPDDRYDVQWWNPRTGEATPVKGRWQAYGSYQLWTCRTPDEHDWCIRMERRPTARKPRR